VSERRDAYKLLWENMRERSNLVGFGLHGKTILKRSSRSEIGAWTRFM
jgi:hypothetical protein